jgi:prepilin-type N-terminal cleavage/methylation domain-containing protein/prepilin-type processing-associated H-X9-DG protein
VRALGGKFVPGTFCETYCFDNEEMLRYRLGNQQVVQPRRFYTKSAGLVRPPLDGRTAEVQLRAFTLIELLVVITVIAILASLLVPVLVKTRAKAQAVFCLSNTRQLNLAWVLYADDHNGRLAYNLGGDVKVRGVAPPTYLNWVNNVLNWELRPDNTNLVTIREASLGPYASKAVNIYRCPSDNVLSDIQRKAGWTARIRSYSMNAMIGDVGDLSQAGVNRNNPDYLQFFSLSTIPQPAGIFVFLDEHPDSINDGYFVNQAYSWEWIDLPASYHNGAASFSFVDGHGETHLWHVASTKAPAHPDAAPLPMKLPYRDWGDYNWVVQHMSVDRGD